MDAKLKLLKFEIRKTLFQKSVLAAFAVLAALIIALNSTPIIIGSNPKISPTASPIAFDDSALSTIEEKGPLSQELRNLANTTANTSSIEGMTTQDLYDARDKAIQKEMDDDAITAQERQYWKDQDAQVQKPFAYQYHSAYLYFLDGIYTVDWGLIILVSICLAGIFASERANRTDQQILCTKHGRSTLCGIKIVTGIACGLILTIGILAIDWASLIALYGPAGASSQIQLVIPACMRPISVLHACLMLTGFVIARSIVMCAIAMFLSQALLSKSATTASMVLIVFLGMFNIPGSIRILSQIKEYSPFSITGSWFLLDYRYVDLFGFKLGIFQMPVIVDCFICLALITLTFSLYKKMQVKGR